MRDRFSAARSSQLGAIWTAQDAIAVGGRFIDPW